MALPTALIVLMGISVAYGLFICDYLGDLTANKLTDASCDIVAFSDSRAASRGRIDRVNDYFHTEGVKSLQPYRCGKTVYYEHRMCQGASFEEFTVNREGQLGSIEDAINYARYSHYDGFIVILCDVDTPEYQAVENEVLLKVKEVAGLLRFPYGIRMTRNRLNFPVNDHKDTARFIVVSHKVLNAGFPYQKTEYDTTLDVTRLLNSWIERGIPASKLVFYIRPLLIQTNTPPNVLLGTSRNLCNQGNKDAVISNILTLTSDIATKIKTVGAGGIFIDNLSYDDYNNICGKGTFSFIKTMKTALTPVDSSDDFLLV